MKLNLTKEEIIAYLNKNEETSGYYKNILKKYPEELNNLIDNLTEIDVPTQNTNTTRDELKEFVLELVIQRLRQLSCFGNPDREYVKRVFNETIQDLKK